MATGEKETGSLHTLIWEKLTKLFKICNLRLVNVEYKF